MPTPPAVPPSPCVLVVGGGGREHALLDALAASRHAPRLVCAPGNAGTAALAENVAVAADDVDALVALAQARQADLVVVGPEGPLVLGLADRLAEAGVPVVGPSRAAARLEGSKAFAKEVMARAGVPTAASRTFGLGALDEARAYVEAHPLPVVLKADGLAGGKGVVVAETREAAREALARLLDGGAFGSAGATVVVEAFLPGEEASVFALTDGETVRLLPAAQDHKRIFDGDAGPNTGGMGAYAPAPAVTPGVLAEVEARVVRPVLAEMQRRGTPYRGCLYVGLMLTPDGPSVVEFNCRLGDPEAQAVLPLVATDAVDLFWALAHGALDGVALETRPGAAACVVLASEGYPGPVEGGRVVRHAESAGVPGARLYHAGTARSPEGNLVTAGGRVLGATGLGATLADALDAAYRLADAVDFDGKQLRRDIGQKGLAHGS